MTAPSAPPVPAPAPGRRVLLVGWDAADWQVIHPLLDAGRMPHLQRLVEGGAMGNLQSLAPHALAHPVDEHRHGQARVRPRCARVH